MRIEALAGRCKLAARSLTTSGLYAHFNYRDYDFSPQEEISSKISFLTYVVNISGF